MLVFSKQDLLRLARRPRLKDLQLHRERRTEQQFPLQRLQVKEKSKFMCFVLGFLS